MPDPTQPPSPFAPVPPRQDQQQQLVFRVTLAERQAVDAYVAYSTAANVLPPNVRGAVADLVASSGRPDAAQIGAYLLDAVGALAGRASPSETFVRALAYVTNVVAEDLGLVFAQSAVGVEVVPDGASPLPRLVQAPAPGAQAPVPVFVPPTPQGSPTPVTGGGQGQ